MKNFKLVSAALLVSILSTGCRSLPNDVTELMGQKQTGKLWVAPSKSFSLKSDPGTNSFKSYEEVELEFDRGGRWTWSESPSILLSHKAGVSKIKIPTDFVEQMGKLLPPEKSGQPYNIRFYRILHPSRHWMKTEKVNDDMTFYDANGNYSTIYDDDYIDHYYMDGDIEYRLAFYGTAKDELVAILYLHKPVSQFEWKSIRRE